MKQYKLYLFDLDGTLLNSDRMIIETFRELYPIFKKGFHPDDNYILQFSGPQITETLKKEFPDLDQKMMLNEYRNRSQKYYDQYVDLYPGARELIEMMIEKKINFGIITNKHRYATMYTYKLLKLEKFNIFSICADDVKVLKPAPEGIYKAMNHFGIKNKDEVIYIGDSIYDYETAKNAGVDFGYVTWSVRQIDKNAKIDAKIDDFKQFAKEI